MAVLLAATHPERVEALVLYGSYAKRLWSPDYPWARTRYRNCPLLVVEMWQLPDIAEEVGVDPYLLDEPARQRAADVLQAQVDKALDGRPRPRNMQVELRTGNPVEVLVELGRTADLLVVGARGRGGFRHLLTGSVATQLVNHAPCPVTIVRSGPVAARG